MDIGRRALGLVVDDILTRSDPGGRRRKPDSPGGSGSTDGRFSPTGQRQEKAGQRRFRRPDRFPGSFRGSVSARMPVASGVTAGHLRNEGRGERSDRRQVWRLLIGKPKARPTCMARRLRLMAGLILGKRGPGRQLQGWLFDSRPVGRGLAVMALDSLPNATTGTRALGVRLERRAAHLSRTVGPQCPAGKTERRRSLLQPGYCRLLADGATADVTGATPDRRRATGCGGQSKKMHRLVAGTGRRFADGAPWANWSIERRLQRRTRQLVAIATKTLGGPAVGRPAPGAVSKIEKRRHRPAGPTPKTLR